MIIWELYEVTLFYANILSLVLFLTISRVFRFYTLREKAGYGAKMRYEMDFLEFAKEDIHWFTTVVQTMFLFVFVLINREKHIFEGGYQTVALIFLGTRHLINASMVANTYFSKSSDYKINTRIVYIYILKNVIFTIVLIYCFVMDDKVSHFTAPYILYEIVLGVCKFFQMLVDKNIWKYKLIIYQREYFKR